MFQLDIKSRKPLYEQIVDNYKRMITSNILRADEKILSVRDLASMLTINPNTIQKAYRELERQGYVYSIKGKGSFVASVEKSSVDLEHVDQLRSQIKNNTWELLHLGIEKDILLSMFNSILDTWKGDQQND